MGHASDHLSGSADVRQVAGTRIIGTNDATAILTTRSSRAWLDGDASGHVVVAERASPPLAAIVVDGGQANKQTAREHKTARALQSARLEKYVLGI